MSTSVLSQDCICAQQCIYTISTNLDTQKKPRIPWNVHQLNIAISEDNIQNSEVTAYVINGLSPSACLKSFDSESLDR